MEDRHPNDAPREEEHAADDQREQPVLKPPAKRVPEGKDSLQRRREWFERRSGSKR
jgi:hypothetical protein